MAHARTLVSLSAGEIFAGTPLIGMERWEAMTSIRRSSKRRGCAGHRMWRRGELLHLADLFNTTPASAAACASVFHFGDNNPIRAPILPQEPVDPDAGAEMMKLSLPADRLAVCEALAANSFP